MRDRTQDRLTLIMCPGPENFTRAKPTSRLSLAVPQDFHRSYINVAHILRL